MPDLEYTVEVSSDIDFELPSAEEMAQIVKQALRDWRPANWQLYLDVQVPRVSDDL